MSRLSVYSGQAWSTVRGQMANAVGNKQTGNAFAQLAGNINQGAKPAKSGNVNIIFLSLFQYM